MKLQQERHLERVITHFTNGIDRKYRAGARKHQGDILSMDTLELIDNAIDEAIDQACYLITLREQLQRAAKRETSTSI